jgi:response regulator RpfG family c-di-GMP phosphodiesterase
VLKTEEKLSVLVAEYAQKTEARRKLDSESKRLATEIAALDARLVEEFAKTGIQNVKTSAGQTVYINREIFAKLVGDQKKAKTALRRAGLGEFIKEGVNAQTLRAYVREMDEVLPKGLLPYIDVTEIYRIRMRSN